MERRKKKLETPAIVMIVVIAVVLLVSIIWIFRMYTSDFNIKYAQIRQHGKVIRTIDLTEVKEPYRFQIDGDDGAYNVIEVRDGSIGIIEASCPDGTCMNIGFIDGGGIPIVCLPNELIIEIVKEIDTNEESTDAGVDLYAY